ncbi:Rha family transcriptional regulator, partial [Ornithobacterium rhinotracheale]
MNNLSIKDTMSSREIAQIAGKNHKEVLRSIRNMERGWVKVSGRNFALAEYLDEQGKPRPQYELTKTECLYIATKFNDEARARLVLRWEALENERLKNYIQIP